MQWLNPLLFFDLFYGGYSEKSIFWLDRSSFYCNITLLVNKVVTRRFDRDILSSVGEIFGNHLGEWNFVITF